MGACNFIEHGRGKTPAEAFSAAVQHAQWKHGHVGYSGTLAEKHDFVVIPVPEGEKLTPEHYAQALMDANDSRIRDKWGPAGCIHIKDDEYLFFGRASS